MVTPPAGPIELPAPARAEYDQFRVEFAAWLDEHQAELEPLRTLPEDINEQHRTQSRVQRLLFDHGWLRRGWPEEVGGLGGSKVVRGALAEALTERGYEYPFAMGMIEVLGSAMVAFSPPELGAEMFPRFLAGEEYWAQGFSEPEAGSDLGSLRTRAVDEGDHWRLTGQKIWTTWGQFAQRGVVLARTGEQAQGFAGITALFIDMDSPGVDVRTLRAMNGTDEFCEMFFDDVVVPKSRTMGAVGGGAKFTMAVLESERGVFAWQRQTWLLRRLSDLLRESAVGAHAADRIGEVYATLYGLRLRARDTFRRVVAGELIGPQSSVDKMLLSTAEKGVFDAAFELLADQALLEDGPADRAWRSDYLYARASSIYGGTAEIQRNILAERLLGLPRERA